MKDQNELKNMGLKATFPRLKILDVFRRNDDTQEMRHLSAEDVYRLLIAEDVDIGLATVYRVLTQFEQAGILMRSQFDGGKAVFELNDGDHHDHFICTNCTKVVEFSDPEIEKRQYKIAEDLGFELESHTLVLYGICEECISSNRVSAGTRLTPKPPAR
ncbi:MAG TPA: ferric iron uptake transcriptional regulator [Paenalcaligenes sp.]|nr:ferric iron uptake transcriptional regulator [Paenalcaligenes sp.]